MSAIRAVTKEDDPVDVDLSAVDTLAEKLRGQLLLPHSDGYDDARQIWNAMIDRRPAMIVRCAGTADVVETVNFSRKHNLLVSIKGGGHNVSGNAVCEGGVMIDLSQMRSVHVDAKLRRARVQGGATWGDFDAETQLYGLATTGGLISATGVAGLTLGGGIGWLSPSFGLACDNLVSAEIVTADGNLVVASEDENSDLFWGLKGGGGNFGVTTSFEFQVFPVGPELFAGMTLYSLDDALEVLKKFVTYMVGSTDQVGALAAFTTTPDGLPVLALIGVYNGTIADGEIALEPVRTFKEPLLDTFGPTSYRNIQTLFDAGAPSGSRYYWKSSFLKGLSEVALTKIIKQARNRTSLRSKIFLEFLGGAFARIPIESAVFDHREFAHNILIIGQWEDEEADEVNRQWTQETWRAMDSFASERVYVNYLGTETDEGSNRLAEAYGPGKVKKLLALKRKYDPTNFFRMNQNIRPSDD